ncbi:MAG: ABC transporter permease [Vicinamibacteria bacterium]|nr:ABC transporter permease [Vicinamibacteria bacterium]
MLKNYLKLSLKILGRRKFFTFVSLFGIGFTLMVLTLAAAMFDHIFSPYPPETRGDRTLSIYSIKLEGKDSESSGPGGYALYDRYMRDLPGVERMSILSMPATVLSYWRGARIQSLIKRTDADFFKILDFEFIEGGPYGEADVTEGRAVAVINQATRTKFFGTAPALGQSIEADGQTFKVVGVVPDVPIFRLMATGDIYVPVTTAKSDDYRQNIRGGFMAMFLLKDRSVVQSVQQEFKARLAKVELPPQFQKIHAIPETIFANLARVLMGDFESEDAGARLLAILLTWAVLFMVLPAVNLVNLNVSRSLERASEIGVRRAFGASARDLLLQFLFENIVISVVGGVLALIASVFMLGALNAADLIPYAHFSINLRIAAWGFVFAVVFGVISGAWPAWRLSRLRPIEALAGGAR